MYNRAWTPPATVTVGIFSNAERKEVEWMERCDFENFFAVHRTNGVILLTIGVESEGNPLDYGYSVYHANPEAPGCMNAEPSQLIPWDQFRDYIEDLETKDLDEDGKSYWITGWTK